MIKNGLTSNNFGESEIKSLGLSVTGFKGDRGLYDSTALTSRCGETYHLLGGPFLAGKTASISTTFSGL